MSGTNTTKITKLEAGKTYRLIDKEGYFAERVLNEVLFSRGCYEGAVFVGEIFEGCGYVAGDRVIHAGEVKFFELVEEEEEEEYGYDETFVDPFMKVKREDRRVNKFRQGENFVNASDLSVEGVWTAIFPEALQDTPTHCQGDCTCNTSEEATGDVQELTDALSLETQEYIKSLENCDRLKEIDGVTDWTDKHYDFNYTLTEADIEQGYIKLDPYFVAQQWKLGEKDDSGVLFHCTKTIARFGEKNPVDREIKALYNQVKRLAELNGVEL